MDEQELSGEQQAEVERIEELLMAQARVEARRIAQLLVTREDSELLGETEFTLRDAMHRIGARGLDAAPEGRKRRGRRGRA